MKKKVLTVDDSRTIRNMLLVTLNNAGFESGLALWDTAGKPEGIAADPNVAHTGKQSVRLTATPASYAGVHQFINFNEPVQHPLRVSGWSKAQSVELAADGACVIFLDGKYADGSPMDREDVKFEAGTHDWQSREFIRRFQRNRAKVAPPTTPN